MLVAMAPIALARAKFRARLLPSVPASQTRAEVIAYASMVTGRSQASRSGQPATCASPRSPAKLATAAETAATVMPTITHQSRRPPITGRPTSEVQSGDEPGKSAEPTTDLRADRRRGQEVAERGAHGRLPERQPGVPPQQEDEDAEQNDGGDGDRHASPPSPLRFRRAR